MAFTNNIFNVEVCRHIKNQVSDTGPLPSYSLQEHFLKLAPLFAKSRIIIS